MEGRILGACWIGLAIFALVGVVQTCFRKDDIVEYYYKIFPPALKTQAEEEVVIFKGNGIEDDAYERKKRDLGLRMGDEPFAQNDLIKLKRFQRKIFNETEGANKTIKQLNPGYFEAKNMLIFKNSPEGNMTEFDWVTGAPETNSSAATAKLIDGGATGPTAKPVVGVAAAATAKPIGGVAAAATTPKPG